MSVLKPRDIANVQFRTAWRGYNEADVDEFVQKIVSAYETLYHEYQQLQEQTGKLQLRLEEYSQTEVQIDETLAFARQAARDAKQAAEQQAAAILAKARVDADQLLRRARRQVEEFAANAMDLARQEAAFRARLREILDGYKSLLVESQREAEQLSRAIMTLTDDEAAVASDLVDEFEDDGDDLPVDTVNPGYDSDADVATGDDVDLEPTRRMSAIRHPLKED